MRSFATLLEEHRTARGWSHYDLGRRGGCHPSYVHKLGTGRRQPSARMVQQLADALGLDAAARDTLFESAGRPAPRPPRPTHCTHCGFDEVKSLGLCGACYMYRWRHGRARPLVHSTICSVCGGPRSYRRGRFCNACYHRLRRDGLYAADIPYPVQEATP